MYEYRYGKCISIISWKELTIFVIYCLWSIFFNSLLLQLSECLLQFEHWIPSWRHCLCRLSDIQEAETRWRGYSPSSLCFLPWCHDVPSCLLLLLSEDEPILPSHSLWHDRLYQKNPASPKLLLPGFDHGDMKKISIERSVLKNRVTAVANLTTWLRSLWERLAVGLGKRLERRLEMY